MSSKSQMKKDGEQNTIFTAYIETYTKRTKGSTEKAKNNNLLILSNIWLLIFSLTLYLLSMSNKTSVVFFFLPYLIWTKQS